MQPRCRSDVLAALGLRWEPATFVRAVIRSLRHRISSAPVGGIEGPRVLAPPAEAGGAACSGRENFEAGQRACRHASHAERK